jgi:hypothetical protein
MCRYFEKQFFNNKIHLFQGQSENYAVVSIALQICDVQYLYEYCNNYCETCSFLSSGTHLKCEFDLKTSTYDNEPDYARIQQF